jgi:large-conductance mechanosensitive channel
MAAKQNFMDWMFKHRDIDGLIIAFLVSGAVATFINDLTIAVMDPIINSMLPDNYDEVYQTLNVFNIVVIRFQLQYVLSGILRMLLTIGVAFLFVRYLYKLLALQVGDGQGM